MASGINFYSTKLIDIHIHCEPVSRCVIALSITRWCRRSHFYPIRCLNKFSLGFVCCRTAAVLLLT